MVSAVSARTPQRREACATGQGAHTSLVAVTARSNRSKSDPDPAQWLPPAPGHEVLSQCTAEWAGTKLRWNVAADDTEPAALRDLALGCPLQSVTYEPGGQPPARVGRARPRLLEPTGPGGHRHCRLPGFLRTCSCGKREPGLGAHCWGAGRRAIEPSVRSRPLLRRWGPVNSRRGARPGFSEWGGHPWPWSRYR